MAKAKVVETRAEKIRLAIEQLRQKGGRVTARAIVDAARDQKHPLHDEFIWSDAKAADQQRLERARELIRYVTVMVIHRSEHISVPVYARDPSVPAREQGYIALTSAEIKKDHALSIVLAELERCKNSIERARGITDELDKRFPGLTARFEDMLDRIVTMHRELEAAE
jgi:hypothetical protein